MFQKLRRNLERNLFGRDPQYQDPYDEPAEQFYGQIYLKHLSKVIEAEFRSQKVRVLDVGCHTGRLSIPLAQAGYEVTAIDSSRFHIKRAEQHALQEGVSCHFIKGEGFAKVRQMANGSFDLVICTEVLYQRADFRECMRELFRLVRAGGLLTTSHRSRFFYLIRAIRNRDFESARYILSHTEGKIEESYFNWQTPQELKTLYEELEADLVLLRPVGIFTGNGADGMALVCDLGKTTEDERNSLFEIEAPDSDEFAGMGRYVLAVGRKRGL